MSYRSDSRFPRLRSGLAGVTALFILAVGLLFFLDQNNTQQVTPTRFQGSSCDPTQVSLYDASYRSTGSADKTLLSFGDKDRRGFEVKLAGTLREVCLGRKEGQRLYAISFDNFLVRDLRLGQATEPFRRMLELEIQAPVYVIRDETNRAVELRFSGRHSEPIRNFFRDYLALSSLVFSGPSPSSRWSTREADLNGDYAATYEAVKSDSRGTEIGKQRAYLDSNKVVLQDSQTIFRLDSRNRISQLSASLHLSIQRGQKTVGVFKTSLEQTLRGHQTLSTTEQEALINLYERYRLHTQPATLAGKEVFERLQKDMLRRQLGDDRAATLKEKILALGSQEDVTIYQKLKALFALYPEDSSAFEQILIDAELDSPAYQTLLGAAVYADSRASQKLLRDAFNRTVPTKARKRESLLGHLGLIPVPDQDTEAFVRSVSISSASPEEERWVAMLALGNIGKTMKDSHPVRFEVIFSDLKALLGTSRTREDRVVVIRALGNLGHDGTTELLQQDLSSRDSDLRSSAILALRFVPSASAEAQLLRALRTDVSEAVRAEAAQSLTHRPRSAALYGVLADCLMTEASERVKAAIMGALSPGVRDYPAVQESLTQLAKEDSWEDIRRYAHNLLLRVGMTDQK